MKRLFNSLYSVKSVLIITTYSVNGETQPFLTASSIVILSHTGAYFLINSSFPSKRSKVPVKHKINLYLTTLKIVENKGLAKRWTSSSISKSHSHCFLITELIISIWQFPNRFLSITFSSHCSFNISVGTTIKTKISGFFSTNKSIISRATRVFPNPVGNTQEAHPPVFNHRLIPSFCLSVLSINNYHKNKLSILVVVSSTSGIYLIFLTQFS